MRYMVNEDEGPVNITILLDQPSCVPITVIARPQAANAKGTYEKHRKYLFYLIEYFQIMISI